MKFLQVCLISAGILASTSLANAQQTQSQNSNLDATTETCLRNCSDDVSCKASCLGVPTPTADQVGQTNSCVRSCNRSNIEAYKACEQNCIHMNYMRNAPSFQGAVNPQPDAAASAQAANHQQQQQPQQQQQQQPQAETKSNADNKPNADVKPATDNKPNNGMDNKPLTGMDKTLASANSTNSTKATNKTAAATGGAGAGASPQSVLAVALGAFSVFGVVSYA
ncbi:hypothetical protein BDF22DRAFT_703807 [Syncephalis plumigaleata]|nr:hypothetical protein BDF22DRAFT_703807 [Syncephalis plumigaleata]